MQKTFANTDKIAGIVKVTENIYKVDVNLLETVDPETAHHKESLTFYNPRLIGMGADADVNGFSSIQLETLKNAIKSQGLINPLVGRYKDGRISLIEGHRRLAVINQLIDEEAECFDPATGNMMPASCLYGFILMRVYDGALSEEECFALSFQEDKTKEKFGVGAEIRFVHYCQMHGISDGKIIEMLNATPEWLKETKNIIRVLEDDEVILQALFSDRINRSAAKSLAMIEDATERRKVYMLAMEEAKEDYQEKLAKMRKQVGTIANKIEVAKTKKVIAEATQQAEEIDKYDDEILQLSEKKQEMEEEITQAAPVVNPESVRKGVAKSNKSGVARIKSAPARIAASERISTKWRKYLEQLKDRPQIGEEEVKPQLIDMCMELLDLCTDKENSPEDFIRRWNAEF